MAFFAATQTQARSAITEEFRLPQMTMESHELQGSRDSILLNATELQSKFFCLFVKLLLPNVNAMQRKYKAFYSLDCC
jgi:hypothetical protein